MSSFAIGSVSDPRPAAYALVRSAMEGQGDQAAIAQKQKSDAVRAIAEAGAQQRVAAQEAREAEAARQHAALVQATTGTTLNVYA
ncbi:hypothetical protein [Cryptosporangium arvum]|uniref:hypothetical protein n=1 Tax=Cryptosporangium arvum TaxID=80871 RepID=UPI0005636665|nr:hypothetical protein [Cryptosporangium arvum]